MSIVDTLNDKCLYKNSDGFCKWDNNDIVKENNYYRTFCYKSKTEYKLCNMCENTIVKTFHNTMNLTELDDTLKKLIVRVNELESRLNKMEK